MSETSYSTQAYVVNGEFLAIGTKEEINKLATEAFFRYINALKIVEETEQLMRATNEKQG
jgi:hypothetical protein